MAATGSVGRAHRSPRPEPDEEAHVANAILPQPFAVDPRGVLYYILDTKRAPSGFEWVQP